MNVPKASSYLSSLMAAILVCFLSPAAVFAEDVPGCGNLANAFGPFDYTDPANVSNLRLVEVAHFTEPVEMLVRGQTSTRPGHDLDYTLRAFPNHHRALYSMQRYQQKYPGGPPPDANYTAECYFMRAVAFKPDDGVVRLLYGIYLAKQGNVEEALQRYKEALELNPDSAEVHYNVGLLYFDLKKYDAALNHAKEAYRRGYPLPGLRVKLEEVGLGEQILNIKQ